jgi:hypothetical protein
MIAQRSLMISEPDVALTDYALALETTILAGLLHMAKGPASSLKTCFIWFYLSIGTAALLGGTFHGFFADESFAGSALWRGVMLCIGLTGYVAWRIGGLLSFSTPVTAWITRLAAVGLAGYCLIVLFYAQTFALAIAYYLPAVVFLTVSFVIQLMRTRDSATLFGTIGMLLTFVAAGVQHFGISLHPQYFNHNAFYHLLQGIALFMIFVAARSLVAQGADGGNHAHH